MKKAIPNIITLLNLSSGCLGVVYAFTSDLRLASVMIFVSLVLDYMDGMAARLLNARSPLGKELDSLADVISFGFLPSVIVYIMLRSSELSTFSYAAFLIAVFSAYRLAKFNIDERQSVNFIGLPTPANALFWSAFPLIILSEQSSGMSIYMAELLHNPYLILTCVFVFSYLLIAELPLFSLKFKNLSWKENKARHIFLFASLILFLIMSYHSVPFIILLYLVISIIDQKLNSNEISGRD